jgi:hypothetical protein
MENSNGLPAGRRKSAESSEEEIGSEGSKAEKKRRRRSTLYDELNEVKPDGEPLPYRLIPVLDDLPAEPKDHEDDDHHPQQHQHHQQQQLQGSVREQRDSSSERERIVSQQAGSEGGGRSETATVKGITFECLIAQWRKITSFAFALQPVSSFSKAVPNSFSYFI